MKYRIVDYRYLKNFMLKICCYFRQICTCDIQAYFCSFPQACDVAEGIKRDLKCVQFIPELFSPLCFYIKQQQWRLKWISVLSEGLLSHAHTHSLPVPRTHNQTYFQSKHQLALLWTKHCSCSHLNQFIPEWYLPYSFL